ncbi:A disintegrin and metalloproteinase with thrombospondin motifs adt-1-like isoform X2 [Hydra vulgaris]|uniref:A disintegrin and metalloproteinase with thrombospondin motifs adt-1-like isoform X2 n=1 Tax=Hydra vulgaris TaxID=6087 RepID=A0ABM4BWU0_HYDVU
MNILDFFILASSIIAQSSHGYWAITSKIQTSSVGLPKQNSYWTPTSSIKFNTTLKTSSVGFSKQNSYLTPTSSIKFKTTLKISSTVLPSSKNLGSTTPTTQNYTLQKCLPITITICEGYSNTIQCPVNSLIEIQSAIYGRNSRSICPSSYNQKSATQLNNCTFSKNVTGIVQKWCNNYNSCLIQSNNGQFNDPCRGIYKYTVVTYSCLLQAAWLQWSDWASCNVSYGFINRTRECNASIGATWCCGNNFEVKPCFVYWELWSNWSVCNASFGSGFMNRTRQCNATNVNDKCSGNNLELAECFAAWTQWNPWSNCNLTDGVISRTRLCNSSIGSVWCLGSNYEAQECYANWGTWSTWSICDILHGVRYANRTRDCMLLNTQQDCPGQNLEKIECLASWTQWSDWSICNSFNGNGFVNRSRDCYPIKNLTSCPGEASEAKQCYAFWEQWSYWSFCYDSFEIINRTRMCSVLNTNKTCYGDNSETKLCFFFWTEWSNWTSCDDSRLMSRTRQCNVSDSDFSCKGFAQEQEECSATWGQWSNWSNCYNNMFMKRTRECYVSNHIESCLGESSDIKQCFVFWTEWSIWTSCSDSELISRTRQCNNSDSDFSCDGFANEERKCSESSCEITFSAGLNESNIIEFCSCNNSECFAKWAVWSEFSTSCGVGYRRSYLISETKIGSVFRDQSCDLGNCPVDGMWGTWSDSKCVNSCGSEVKTYERNCDKPYPLFYGRDCIGLSAYINSCEDNTICPVNGKWSLWSSWSACSQPCNGGVKSRFRSCSNPTPKYGGLNCNGKNKKIHKCNLQKCQSRYVNLAIDFLDEDFINSYIMLSDGRSNLKDRIIQAITKLYSDRKVNASFSIVLHSIKEQP